MSLALFPDVNNISKLASISFILGLGWGWSGKLNDTQKVLEDVLLLQEKADCPVASAIFEKYDQEFHVDLDFILTRPFNNFGKCCQVKLPHNARSFNETLLMLKVREPASETKYQGKKWKHNLKSELAKIVIFNVDTCKLYL